MRTIPLNGGHVAILDDEDFERMSQYHWYWCNGYVWRHPPMINAVRKPQISMHREVMNALPKQEIDHINRNRSDNRKSNLRVATRRQNAINWYHKNGTTGARGVKKRKRKRSANCYEVGIRVNGKNRYLGMFATLEEAKETYNSAAKKYHGDFAILN